MTAADRNRSNPLSSGKVVTAIILLLTGFFQNEISAQRSVTYTDLLQRADRPGFYQTHTVLPATGENSLFVVSFRLDYNSLPFRQVQTRSNENQEERSFTAVVRLNTEIFRDRQPLSRKAWIDTVRTETYEQTQSLSDFLEGAVAETLSPGEYRLRVDINNREGANRISPRNQRDSREDPSREQAIKIPDFQEQTSGTITLLSQSDRSDGQIQVRLLNFGSQLLYGEDAELLVQLPPGSVKSQYQLNVYPFTENRERNSDTELIYSTTIERSSIFKTEGFQYSEAHKEPILLAREVETGYSFFLVSLPNSQFPNQSMEIVVTAADENTPVATQRVDSRWIDMPVSLLNLDVAIDMLKFIRSETELRDMKRGNRTERERRFRMFWKERDPTPETEFNELMVEFYSRIDQAWNRFTTPEKPGYDSDQGRALILYGEPRRTERRYPTDAPTQEIWHYPDRTLIFEATTGFGDFRLVREE